MPHSLPIRSKRYGVGKEIGGAVYVHRQYESLLGKVVATARQSIAGDFEYQVVKYNYRTGSVSFIESPNFDTAAEPTVGDMVIVDTEGNLRRRPQPSDPEVYHHKWLFVGDDYEGFDVAESKQRSLRWLRLKDVDRCRIGRRSYWEQSVLPRLIDEDET